MTVYTVHFYDPRNERVIEIFDNTTIISMEYERLVNDVANFTMTCRGESRLAGFIDAVDLVADVYRVNPKTNRPDLENTFLIRHMEIFQDADGQEFIIVAGYGAEHFLTRRLILPVDDHTGAGGWSSKAGPASTVIKEFVNDQCIEPLVNLDRFFRQFSIDVQEGVGGYVFQRVQYELLLEVVQECALRGNIDFRVRHDGLGFFTFECANFGNDYTRSSQEPFSKFYMFNLDRGNILSPRMTFDRRDEKTVVYVFGQGPEIDREVVTVKSFARKDSMWNFIEDRTDARNNELGDYAGLYADGEFYIKDHAAKKILAFEISEVERVLYYNVRWSLWDLVTGSYKGVETDLRIMGIRVALDEKGDKIDVVLAEPSVFVDPEIAALLRAPGQDAIEAALGLLQARQKKQNRERRRNDIYSDRAEVAGARPRSALADIDTANLRVGMMFWVTDGRKPGETAGNGTGVPAEWDGSDLISGYSGNPVVV